MMRKQEQSELGTSFVGRKNPERARAGARIVALALDAQPCLRYRKLLGLKIQVHYWPDSGV